MKAREAIHRFVCKSANFIMLYTGEFVLRYYVGFSQIRSQLCNICNCNVIMLHLKYYYCVNFYKTLMFCYLVIGKLSVLYKVCTSNYAHAIMITRG